MKIFPIIRKLLGGGGVGLGMDMGQDTQTDRLNAATTLDQGQESESMGHAEAANLPTGQESESMQFAQASGSATSPTGQDSQRAGGITPDNPTSFLDSSGNGRNGTPQGTIPRVTSPWSGFGRAALLDGIDLDASSMGINCGASGTGFSTAFTMEAKVRRDRLATVEVVAGRIGATNAARNYALFFNTDDKLYAQVRTASSSNVNVTSAATVPLGTHDVALVYDGTNIMVFVDGVKATIAVGAALQDPDGTTPLWIGRDAETSAGGAPFPFKGVVEEFRLSNIARYAADYTPSTNPFETDNNTVILYHMDDVTANDLSATGSLPNGTESEAFAASAVADIDQFASGSTAIQNSGTPNWSNPANADGDFNGTEANHPGLSGIQTASDATLRCPLPSIGSTPSGFTRTAVKIAIRHRWDCTITLPVAGVTDVVYTIELRDNANALISTLKTRRASDGDASQATLITEIYDITGLVSEAQLAAGVKVDCHANVDYVPAANGNSSWDVDAIHLRAAYTKSGIT